MTDQPSHARGISRRTLAAAAVGGLGAAAAISEPASAQPYAEQP